MNDTLGIDIGTSAVKLSGLEADGSALPTLRRPIGKVQELLPLLEGYLLKNSLTRTTLERIALTGVGAAAAAALPWDIPTQIVDEFSACAAGALLLTGRDEGVVVSMGTGTAFLHAQRDGSVRHLCGSGIGGGTLDGLCHALAGASDFSQLSALAAQGRLHRVDLTIRDLGIHGVDTLDPDMTAANFGHLAPDASPADLAAGAVNLVLQAIGTMAVLSCRLCGADTAILIGSVAALEQAGPNFALFEQLYGIRFLCPPSAPFAAAIGAAQCLRAGGAR